MPTWEKFGAPSPQFADVGPVLFRWYSNSNTKHQLDDNDKDFLIRWLSHELLHKDYIISEKDNSINELKKKIKCLI